MPYAPLNEKCYLGCVPLESERVIEVVYCFAFYFIVPFIFVSINFFEATINFTRSRIIDVEIVVDCSK